MRLIDADALSKVLGFADPCANCKHVYGVFLCDDAIWQEVCDAIYEAPTIDATPVRHGHWTHERLVSASGGTYAVVRCSECKWQHPMLETKFCPNCGAKMDEQ